MPDSYVRSTDGSLMIEFAPGMYTSVQTAEKLALAPVAVIHAMARKARARRAAA